jgi:ubiquinone/menaquinone biosynthesis C-methylase UbiE
MQARFGPSFPLVEAFAEEVPLPDASFDLAVSEYGASVFADPRRWIREAHRLLRPGGRLVFMRASPLLYICGDEEGRLTERLHRSMRGMNRFAQSGARMSSFLPTATSSRLYGVRDSRSRTS